ncbi:MAG: PepSY-associated TM helix domain-containing protein, partial [Steroidobacter sp.]
MLQSFRQSMTWLHTWFGLVLGYVLVVVFFFGALSVFDREIDRWAIPETRLAPQPMPSFDKMLESTFRSITAPDAEDLELAKSRVVGPIPDTLPVMDWSAYTTHRDPVLTLYASFDLPNAIDPDDHIHGHKTINPSTGEVLNENQLNIGSEFFYPLHYSLHWHWKDLGYWVVGLAALMMLAALVSGVVMHRKIFRELFTFRPRKQTQRSTLDLHNLTGVVALPFHFMFALSGLIIFARIYFPVGETVLKQQAEAYEAAEAQRTGLPHDPAGVPAKMASVDAMVAEAQRRWAEKGMAGEVGFLFVNHVDDANATVSIYRAGTDRVTLTGEGIHFSGTTGELIREDPPATAVGSITNFVTGLHLQHFRHWLLRWLYFVGGMAGAVCIATGFIFFVEKRKKQHAKQGVSGARWVDALAVTTVTGTVIAALS